MGTNDRQTINAGVAPRGDEDAAAICGAAIAGWRALVGL